MRKPTICIGENKDADQLRGDREADQRLCFRYKDSTLPLLLKSEISSFLLYCVTVQPGLCQIWSEPQIVGFLMHRLNYELLIQFSFFQIESMKSLIGFPTSMYNDTFLLEKYRSVSISVNFNKQLLIVFLFF